MNVSIEKQKLEFRKALSKMSRVVSIQKYSAKRKSQELMKELSRIVKEAEERAF